MNLDHFGPAKVNKKSVVPDHYVKHIDPVFEEDNNMQSMRHMKIFTEEKNWSFEEKNFEITEIMIQGLKKNQIDISPSDCEWVIDCFEKTAINDKLQSKQYLINQFKKRVPEDVVARVSERAMEQIYDYVWKNQRESRANRSFIRLFWCYQDRVGDDNFATFASNPQKSRPNVRLKLNQKVNNYMNCFIERENSILLCNQLQLMNEKLLHDLDIGRLEDA